MELTNCINFIHKNNAGLVVSGVVKHLSDEPGTFTDVFVNYRTGHHLRNTQIMHEPLSEPKLETPTCTNSP